MKDQFYLYFDTMPKGTAQQKGVMVRNGKPIFYRKDNVQSARNHFMRALKPYKPIKPSDKPVKLHLWFAFDVKDKKKWGKYKPTMPDADNIATVIGKSYAAPSFLRSAGARLTVILFVGTG